MRKIAINLIEAALNPEDMAIAEACLNKGHLRATKPKNPKNLSEADSGIAKYVWRLLVFSLSNENAHQCMPVMADFDLPGKYASEEFKEAHARGNRIEKAIMAIVPKHEWVGVARWRGLMGEVIPPTN